MSSLIIFITIIVALLISITTTTSFTVDAAIDCFTYDSFPDYPTVYEYPSGCTQSTVTSCTTTLNSCLQANMFSCSGLKGCFDTYLGCIRTAVENSAVRTDPGCQSWATNASSLLQPTATYGTSTPSYRSCGNIICRSTYEQGRNTCAGSWTLFSDGGNFCAPWYTVTTTTTNEVAPTTSTNPPPTTTTTNPPPTTTTVASNRQTFLADNSIGLAHEWTEGDNLFWTIDVPATDNQKWVAVGTAPSSMGLGKVVACVVGFNQCAAYETLASFSVAARTDSNLQFISATTENGRIYTKVRVSASAMNAEAHQSKRIIFAKGTFNLISQQPNQHAFSDRGSDPSYLFAGPPTTTTAAAPATTMSSTSTTTTTSTSTSTSTATSTSTSTTTTVAPPTTLLSSTTISSTTSTTSSTTVTVAPPPTTMMTTTVTDDPLASPTPPSTASTRIEGLNGGIGIDYEWTSSDPDHIFWKIDVPATDNFKWVGVGIAASGMGPGKVVACIVGFSQCQAFSTTPGAVQSRTDSGLQFISQTTMNNRAYIRVKATASLMDVVANTEHRIIFAKGIFNLPTQQPTQHSVSDRGWAMMTLEQEEGGSSDVPTSQMPTFPQSESPTSSSSSSSSSSNSNSQPITGTHPMTSETAPSTSSSGSSDSSFSAEAPTTTTDQQQQQQSTTTTAATGSSASSSSSSDGSGSQQTQMTTNGATPTFPQDQTTITTNNFDPSSTASTASSSSSSGPAQQTTISGATATQATTNDNGVSTTTVANPNASPTTESGTGVSTPANPNASPTSPSGDVTTVSGAQQQTTTQQQQQQSSASPPPPTPPQQQTTFTQLGGTTRPIPTAITRKPTTAEPELTPAPPAPTQPPQLEFTITINPKPGQTTVDVNQFQTDLANLIGTSTANIVLTTGETLPNGTVTVSVKFLEPSSRTRLQDDMQNMTASERDQLSIIELNAAPSATTAAPPVDEDWTLIFVALAFMGFIAIVGFFAYRKLSKEMKDKKKNSKQSMDSFKESLMTQYAMDYGDEAGGVGMGAAASGAGAQEMLTTSNLYQQQKTHQQSNKNGSNSNQSSKTSQQQATPQQQELHYDEEGNAFYYDDEGNAWYCEEDGTGGVSTQEHEEL